MGKNLIATALIGVLLFTSCGTSKTTTRRLERDTYSQPGMELLEKNRKDMFRAWAVGKSNSEMTAKAKAQALAAEELASMVEKTVESTVENYSVTLSEGDIAKGKELMSKQFKITVNQVLKGAIPIYDKWGQKDENGLYSNYIVLELKGSEVVNKLYEDYKANKENTVTLNEELLNEIFMKEVNK